MYGGAPMGGGGAPGGGGSSQLLILTGDWPFQTDKCRTCLEGDGARISKLCRQGLVRRDIIIDKEKVGTIIGSCGSTLQVLLPPHPSHSPIYPIPHTPPPTPAPHAAGTAPIDQLRDLRIQQGAPPPGYGDDQRLIVIMGHDAQVAQGVMQIENLLGSRYGRVASREACVSA